MKKMVSIISIVVIAMIVAISTIIMTNAAPLHINPIKSQVTKVIQTPIPTKAPTTIPTIAPTKFEPSPQVSANTTDIDETSNGKTITINKGDSLKIVLISNATTGYEWDIDSFSSEGILKLISHKYISPITGLDGAPGKDEFLFQGDSKGSTNLSLKYWRSFSKSIASTFSVVVNVQ